MNRKKVIAAAAFSAALAGGGVAGAVLGAPTTSGAAVAQSASSASTSSDSSSATQASPDPAKGDRRGPGLDAAATALGMSVDELKAALDGGKTIAQVASDRGVDVNTVIDAMVTSATGQLRQRITDFVNNGFPAGAPSEHGPGGGRAFGGGPRLDAAASALGISATELRSALESGKTIAQVASDKGVDVNTVIAAVAAEEQKEIDARLASGDITQAQADQMKASATQEATDLVNGTRPKGGPGREAGHGGPPPGAPAAPPASSSSSSSSSTSS